MNILIIDCKQKKQFWGCSDLRKISLATLSDGTITTRRAPDFDLPNDSKDYDGVILSGSGASAEDKEDWIEYLCAWLRNLYQEKTPLLGICFGHQMIARALGGLSGVGKAKIPEVGWTNINLKKDQFFSGLKTPMISFSHHYDEVKKVPDGFLSLASSSDCQIQALRSKSVPWFGIQFHPERTPEEAEQLFNHYKKTNPYQALWGYGKSKNLFDQTVGKKLFQNFFEICSRSR